MQKDGVDTFYAESPAAWRNWLSENHASQKSIWLIIYRKESGVPSLTYNEAVNEALCFGWIDSKPNKRDEKSFFQFFAKRNPKSNWSKVNKDKVEMLLANGKMTAAGLQAVDLAKQNGTWVALDDVENLVIPEDLNIAFEEVPLAKKHFEDFPRSVKRGILEWLLNAKKAETRQKRIKEIVEKAAQNIRANQFKS